MNWDDALDVGVKLGLAGMVMSLIAWFVKRRVAARDSALARGRERVEQARPEVVPIPGATFWENDPIRGVVNLANQGPGVARNIRVTFAGSTACGRVPEIAAGQQCKTPEMRLDDAPFFHLKLEARAEITIQFSDRYKHEYVVVVPVNQEGGGNGRRFVPSLAYDDHQVSAPRITAKMLREIGRQ
jgi:hypothetical protein